VNQLGTDDYNNTAQGRTRSSTTNGFLDNRLHRAYLPVFHRFLPFPSFGIGISRSAGVGNPKRIPRNSRRRAQVCCPRRVLPTMPILSRVGVKEMFEL